MSPALQQVIASNLPTETLHMALTHASASIRLVAFQSLESVIAAYSQTSSIESEADMWQYAFPYAMKSTTESKEYISSLLQCLSCFLDRFSVWEASKVSKKSEAPLPKLHSFLSDFLINSLVVKKGVYPSVPEKELFTLALVELVLSFVTQDQSFVSDSCVVRNGIVFNRQRLPEEIITMENIARCLLHRELFAALFALLHSPWDNTRAGAFRCLSKLVILAQAKNIQLPTEYSASDERSALEARGVYLASSPRQREADTGARILAYLYISLDSETDRDLYLGILVDLLQSRLLSMKEELQCILKGTGERGDGGGLPLAHGIIHSVRLAVEHRRILKRHRANVASSMSSSIFERMMRVFCQGIQVSLAVVADVREGEMVEGMDDEIAFNEKTPLEGASSRSTPLNVNTGAIGANGVISSISTTDELEAKARLIMQRIVVSIRTSLLLNYTYLEVLGSNNLSF